MKWTKIAKHANVEKKDYIKTKKEELIKARSELASLETAYREALEKERLKELAKKEQESLANLAYFTEETIKARKLIKEIGKECYDKLRNLFTRYATVFNFDRSGYIDLTQFRLFCNEIGLSSQLAISDAEVVYHYVNQRGLLNFWKFIKVMKMLSNFIHQDHTETEALEIVGLELCFPAQREDNIDRNHELWDEQLEFPMAKDLFESHKKLLQEIFNVYSQKIYKVLCLKEFLGLCMDLELIPGIMSCWEASRIFRSVINPEIFEDCVTYEEFLKCLGYIALSKFHQQESEFPYLAISRFLNTIESREQIIREKKFELPVIKQYEDI
ncbi:unnamed protein product [Blepharisma stoltei]|uniref:EF-hand domain-containing protein n=1 Tax=Blepharisma stoltei TaxID=1481888 RepID=A0AAU9K1W0_9CILI|nr:unnamed protein product [Blepharisma stoltei]